MGRVGTAHLKVREIHVVVRTGAQRALARDVGLKCRHLLLQLLLSLPITWAGLLRRRTRRVNGDDGRSWRAIFLLFQRSLREALEAQESSLAGT
jgi:hypothetical protein